MPQDLFAEYLVKKSARTHGVDEKVVLGMAKQESGTNPGAVSKAGARGTLQVMPKTGTRFVSEDEFNTVEGQIDAGVKYYKYLRDRYGNDEQAIAGYHAGEGAVDRAIAAGKKLPDTYDRYADISTQDHVKAVMSNAANAGPDLFEQYLAKKTQAEPEAPERITTPRIELGKPATIPGGPQASDGVSPVIAATNVIKPVPVIRPRATAPRVQPKAMPPVVAPRQPSSTEKFLSDQFEQYKAQGNLPVANEMGLKLQKDYGWEFGAQADEGGTQWPYVKPPAAGLSKDEAYAASVRPGAGSTAFINQIDAAREQKRKQEEFAKTDQRGIVRRAAEGFSRGARETLDTMAAGAGRLLKNVQELPGDVELAAKNLTTSQAEQDRMAEQERATSQPSISARTPNAGERMQNYYTNRAEEARQAQALRGQDPASQVGHGVGSAAPLLIPGAGGVGFGVESGLMSYGEGAPLSQAILTGVMNARGLQGGHQLGETLAARLQNPFTRFAGRAAGTAAGLETVRAGTGGGIPDTPEAVAHEALTVLGFTLMGGRWRAGVEAHDALGKMLGDPTIHPDVKVALADAWQNAEVPVTAGQPRLIRGKMPVEVGANEARPEIRTTQETGATQPVQEYIGGGVRPAERPVDIQPQEAQRAERASNTSPSKVAVPPAASEGVRDERTAIPQRDASIQAPPVVETPPMAAPPADVAQVTEAARRPDRRPTVDDRTPQSVARPESTAVATPTEAPNPLPTPPRVVEHPPEIAEILSRLKAEPPPLEVVPVEEPRTIPPDVAQAVAELKAKPPAPPITPEPPPEQRAVEAPVEPKEPWQMTQDEFADQSVKVRFVPDDTTEIAKTSAAEYKRKTKEVVARQRHEKSPLIHHERGHGLLDSIQPLAWGHEMRKSPEAWREFLETSTAKSHQKREYFEGNDASNPIHYDWVEAGPDLYMEYRAGNLKDRPNLTRTLKELISTTEAHRNSIKQAIAEGKPVPPAVLADYPDLVKAKTEAVKPPPAPLTPMAERKAVRERLKAEGERQAEAVKAEKAQAWRTATTRTPELDAAANAEYKSALKEINNIRAKQDELTTARRRDPKVHGPIDHEAIRAQYKENNKRIETLEATVEAAKQYAKIGEPVKPAPVVEPVKAEVPVTKRPIRAKAPRRNLAQEYLSEQINYGGEIKTRGEVRAEMQREGTPQKQIDAYMMGAKTITEAAPTDSGLIERANEVKPLDSLRAKPSRSWAGNYAEPGEMVTDGSMAIAKSALNKKQHARAEKMSPSAASSPRTLSQRRVADVLDMSASAAKTEKEPLGYRTSNDKDILYLADKGKDSGLIGVDAQKYQFIAKNVDFDSVRGSESTSGDARAIVFFKGEKPVAALMPVNIKDARSQIDVATARKALGTPTAQSEGYGSRNKIITKSDAADAKEILTDKTKRHSGGPDLEETKALARLALYHAEAISREGAAKFEEFASWLKSELGDAYERVSPHLKAVWDEAVGKTQKVDSAEPHYSTTQPRDEAGRFDGPPQERSLPKNLEAAQLEKGGNLTYERESIKGGIERGREIVAEKGVDGAIEHVLRGDAGIEWASTGYAAMEGMRAEEAKLRATDPTAADAVAAKRLKFVGDFAEEATKRGQAIAGIKAIEEFAPDRATYTANRLSQKNRKRPLSPEEDARITKIGEDLQAANDRIRHLETQLDAAKAKVKTGSRPSKSTYQSKLEESALTAKAALAAKVGKLDFGGLSRSGERGAVKLHETPLEGDAELLAQYAASRLNKANTVAELNAELVKEFGDEVSPHLASIRRRAYAIRQEARLSEIGDSEPSRQRTILSEIQAEINESQRRATEGSKRSQKELKTEATELAGVRRIQEGMKVKADKEAERERLAITKRQYQEASDAQKKAYRESLSQQRKAAKTAALWDTPIRNEARDAKTRLASATDAQTAMPDLVSVAAEMLLPEPGKNVPRVRSLNPSKFYADLKSAYPGLVTRKNQGQIYRQAFQRLQDSVAASRDAARLASADTESKRLWEKLGMDVDAQAILIQRAEAARQQLEHRAAMAQEFERVGRSRLSRVLFEIQSAPRALQSSIDAPIGRQGLFYSIIRPIESARAMLPATWRGYTAGRRATFEALNEEMRQHPDYKLAVRSGLDLTKMASESAPHYAAEETFQSTIAERLPHVRLSEQGYVAGMNAQRLAMFSRYADYGRSRGYTPESHPEFFEQAARRVNIFTGRGSLSQKAQALSSASNWLLYSARLQVSRVQMLADMLNPVKYTKFSGEDPGIRRIRANEAIRTAAAMAVIYGTAKAIGLKVTANPDDPDFGKIVVGNTHYDVTGGEAGTVRLIVRLVQLAGKMATGDNADRKKAADKTVDVAESFARKKLAPIPQSVWSYFSGTDAVGKPTDAKKIALSMVEPMIVGDIIDAANEEGWIGVAKTSVGLAGIGTSTYDPNKQRSSRGSRSHLPGIQRAPGVPRF